MAITAAEARASKKYHDKNRVSFNFALNRATEQDIIDWLSCMESKNGYIKALIRADMAAHKGGKE